MEIQPRTDILQAIANRLAAIKLPHPLRVGIDGVSASGKTVLADELAVVLQKMNRKVIRTGIDGFEKSCRNLFGCYEFAVAQLAQEILTHVGKGFQF